MGAFGRGAGHALEKHDRSRMTIDPRISHPYNAGTMEHVGFSLIKQTSAASREVLGKSKEG